MNKLVQTAALTAALAPTVCSASQFFDPTDGYFDVSKYLSENAYGFLPVPIIITDPALEGGLGAVGLFFHEDEDSQQERLDAMRNAEEGALRYLLPPSVSAVAIAATGNESWFAGGGHMGFFRDGDIRYTVGGGYGDVNLDFYGAGDFQLNSPIELKTKATAFVQVAKFRLPESRWFLGVTQRYISAEISPNRLGDLEDIIPPDWSDALKKWLTTDVTTSGLGVIAEYDSRDNIFSPSRGAQYQVELRWFDDVIGSDIDYSTTSAQGLNFWTLNKNWRAGLKVAAEHANADSFLPPFAMPSLDLRGIALGRYQGMLVGMAESELVYNFNSRWRALAFVGSGRASNSTGEFSDAKNRNIYGAGFRYHIARRYGLDMGIDVAQGPDGGAWYITVGSAWAGI